MLKRRSVLVVPRQSWWNNLDGTIINVPNYTYGKMLKCVKICLDNDCVLYKCMRYINYWRRKLFKNKFKSYPDGTINYISRYLLDTRVPRPHGQQLIVILFLGIILLIIHISIYSCTRSWKDENGLRNSMAWFMENESVLYSRSELSIGFCSLASLRPKSAGPSLSQPCDVPGTSVPCNRITVWLT